MLYKSNVPVTIEINTVQDLSKLGAFMKHNNLKVNKSEIARALNINRRTVTKYLNGFQKCTHRNKPSRLDKYTDIISELLSSDTQVFSYRSILYRYMCDNYSLDVPAPTFYHYLKKHPEFDDYFKKGRISNADSNPVIRFETKPGCQAQIDWKESLDFVLRDTGEDVTINVLVLVFSYSRFRMFNLSLSKSREVLIHLLSECFDMIGGVPQEIVTDNMKSIMDSARTCYRMGSVNQSFEAFADDYGFSVKPCIAATPRTKGKVETQMKFLDEIKAYSGQLNLTELAEIEKAISKFSGYEAVGISCGGPLNSKKGIIMSPPNLLGGDNIPITKILEERFNVPVFLKNDADACALAEWRFGAGKGSTNMIFLTFGTGLGAGLILNGRLYSGACDCAGESGHIRLENYGPVGYGKAGSFEGFCSGGGIAQYAAAKAREMMQTGKKVSYCESADRLNLITAKSVAEKAEQGFKDAAEVYSDCGKMLGRGLSILIDLLNPEKIVIGSIFMRAEKLLRDEMQKVIDTECLKAAADACRIVPAALGESIGDVAAVSVAADGIERIKR